MAMIRRGRSRHFVSQNKCIYLWDQQLAHVRKTRMLKAIKLVDDISREQKKKKYNSAEVILKLDSSNISDSSDLEVTATENLTEVRPTIILQWTKAKDTKLFDKLCAPSIESKPTWMMRHNKSITRITNKLDEIPIDFWGPHYPSF